MDAANNTPRFRLALGAVVTAALLVPLAVYGAPAIAKSASSAAHQYHSSCGQYGASSSEYQYGSSGGQYGSACQQYRVTICHRTHSKKNPWRLITVSSRSLKAHLRHGDTMPPCSTVAPSKSHGDHGKSDGKGKGHGKSSGAHD